MKNINLLIVNDVDTYSLFYMDPLAYADFQEIFANKIHRGFFSFDRWTAVEKKRVGRFKIFPLPPSPTGVQKPHFGCFESQRVAFLVDLGALQFFLAHVASTNLILDFFLAT